MKIPPQVAAASHVYASSKSRSDCKEDLKKIGAHSRTKSKVVDIIASHPDHDIVIGIDTLGKEYLLLHISRALRTKIWVWPERLQMLHLDPSTTAHAGPSETNAPTEMTDQVSPGGLVEWK
ncbi:5' exonuclease Apollo [Cinnamomum micranthum f. kanehirae]|uniref:5' exonuclease Apollo n=1 Tax=Cinnamomum micranthum f. kanehirae TaxID=337451 RepID=A0A443PJK8_9MAGN|nr:5' exonuclease Apollo [Cinnamomum micranthum f. kanehirae]